MHDIAIKDYPVIYQRFSERNNYTYEEWHNFEIQFNDLSIEIPEAKKVAETCKNNADLIHLEQIQKTLEDIVTLDKFESVQYENKYFIKANEKAKELFEQYHRKIEQIELEEKKREEVQDKKRMADYYYDEKRYKEALDLYMQIRDDIDVIEEIKSCEDWLQWQHKDNIISNIIGIPMLIIFLGGVLIFIIALIKNIFKTIF